MPDLENASRGSQLVGPKGAVLEGFVSGLGTDGSNPDTDPADATIKRVEERGKTAKNNNVIH